MNINSAACGNCEREIAGPDQKFCPECGQKTPIHRIDWHFLWHELQHGVLHVDGGIIGTSRQLITRPGHLIREYLAGKRASQFKPLLMLVVFATIWTLGMRYVLGTDAMAGTLSDTSAGLKAGLATGKGDAEMGAIGTAAATVSEWITAHLAAAILIALPLFALCFKIAFRRFRSINYPEWMVVSVWLTLQAFIFFILMIPVMYFTGHVQSMMTWMMVIMPAVNAFAMTQFLKTYPVWKTLIRTLFAYGLYTLVTTAATLAAMVIYGLLVR